MEECCSVNSPRRVRNLSKNRKADVSFSDADDLSPTRFGVSGEHGPKLSEVYGFVGSITIVVATGLIHFLLFFCFFLVMSYLLAEYTILHESRDIAKFQCSCCFPVIRFPIFFPRAVRSVKL